MKTDELLAAGVIVIATPLALGMAMFLGLIITGPPL
jgi:hypothetical protein